MTVSTENATTPNSTKSRNPNSSVQVQIQTKSQFEFVPRDTEKSEFLDLVDMYDMWSLVVIGAYGPLGVLMQCVALYMAIFTLDDTLHSSLM